MEKLAGKYILLEALKAQGIKYIFGNIFNEQLSGQTPVANHSKKLSSKNMCHIIYNFYIPTPI